jgi:hypothetical protein
MSEGGGAARGGGGVGNFGAARFFGKKRGEAGYQGGVATFFA